MTTPPDDLRLSEIARSLNRREWRPTDEEVRVGGAFFDLVRPLERQPQPDFPYGRDWWERLHTENVTGLARSLSVLRDELLPGWREQLPTTSPMIELIELYIRGAQPLEQHADRVLDAWRAAVLPEPTADEIAYEARRLNVSADKGEIHLRYANAARWEKEPHRQRLWDELAPVWTYLGAVRSTMMAAVTGDVDY